MTATRDTVTIYYKSEYVPAHKNYIADMFSRLPFDEPKPNVNIKDYNINLISEVFSKIIINIIITETHKDIILKKVQDFPRHDWLKECISIEYVLIF